MAMCTSPAKEKNGIQVKRDGAGWGGLEDGAEDATLQGMPSDRASSQKITSKGLRKTATGYGGMTLKGYMLWS